MMALTQEELNKAVELVREAKKAVTGLQELFDTNQELLSKLNDTMLGVWGIPNPLNEILRFVNHDACDAIPLFTAVISTLTTDTEAIDNILGKVEE